MVYNDENFLNPLDWLKPTENFYIGDIEDISLGKKLKVEDFKYQNDGDFFIKYKNHFSIMNIDKNTVKYYLNRMELC
jgi:tRNA pseudouridine55 synthase